MNKIIILIIWLLFSNKVYSVSLNFKDVNIREVAFIVSEITQKNIVIPSSINAHIDLNAPSSVSNKELLNLFYSAVLSVGLGFEINNKSIFIKDPEQKLFNNSSFYKSQIFNIEIDKDLSNSLPDGSFIYPVGSSVFIYTSPKFLNFFRTIERNIDNSHLEIVTEMFRLSTVKPSSLSPVVPSGLNFVAYDDINRLLVSGERQLVEEFAKVIKEIDMSLNVYKIDLIIVSADKSFSNVYNLDLSIASKIGAFTFGGGFGFNSSNNLTQSLLTWIDSERYVNLLSKPYLQLLDGHSSSLVIGQEIPFKTSKLDRDLSSSESIITIERKNVGLLLDVSISSLNNNKVRLNIYQEFSSISNTQFFDTMDIITDKQSLRTTLDITTGVYYIIGGLTYRNAQNLETSSPFFDSESLSILDDIFTDTNQSSSERDLIIFIKITSGIEQTQFYDEWFDLPTPVEEERRDGGR